MKTILSAVAAIALAVSFAPTASAGYGDQMYRVGEFLQPGDYKFVVNAEWGAYRSCSAPTCTGASGTLIHTSGPIDGRGSTGYLTVPADAAYFKTKNLDLYFA